MIQVVLEDDNVIFIVVALPLSMKWKFKFIEARATVGMLICQEVYEIVTNKKYNSKFNFAHHTVIFIHTSRLTLTNNLIK